MGGKNLGGKVTDAVIWSTGEGSGDSLAVHSNKRRSLRHSPYLIIIEQNGARFIVKQAKFSLN